jgi:hypothetical protein
MMRDVWTTVMPRALGEEIIVAKVAKGTAPNRWLAQRVIDAVRTKVPLDQIALEVVVMDGEPDEQPIVIGSSPDAENFVRSVVPQLAGCRWRLARLEL